MKYRAILEANETEFKSEGSTIEEALANLPLDMLKLKTKSDLTIIHGKRKAKRHLILLQGRQMLRNELRRSALSKQLEALLR